jgi:hypothetical protein
LREYDRTRLDFAQFLYEKVKGYGVKVVTAPARLFSPAVVARMSICHLVPAISTDPLCVYSRKAKKQSENRNQPISTSFLWN